MFRNLVILLFVFATYGCASAPDTNQLFMSASYQNMTDRKFDLEAAAPKEVIHEYALCKAIWYADHKKIEEISLSKPVYRQHLGTNEHPVKIEEDWIVLQTTAYLSAPYPAGDSILNVKEISRACRSDWDWYR